MTPEQLTEFNRMKEQIKKFESFMMMLRNDAQYDADLARALSRVVGTGVLTASGASPSDYDQAVNEAGASSYNVASVPDGFKLTSDNKLIPYYNI